MAHVDLCRVGGRALALKETPMSVKKYGSGSAASRGATKGAFAKKKLGTKGGAIQRTVEPPVTPPDAVPPTTASPTAIIAAQVETGETTFASPPPASAAPAPIHTKPQ